MIKALTSLSFLYLFVIVALLLYGYFHRRNGKISGHGKNRFAAVFLMIGLACFGFLWVNIHAPLRLKTFSNLDHHFIRHDGYAVHHSIELGLSDTVNYPGNAYNRFLFSRKNGGVGISSSYSEEPFYMQSAKGYLIASINFPARGHRVSFKRADVDIAITATADDEFELRLGENVVGKKMNIKRGITAWNLFSHEDAFINSPFYFDDQLAGALKQVYLLRDEVSIYDHGDLKFFISGKLFAFAGSIHYDDKHIQQADLVFNTRLADQTRFAWGLGFLSNNRNQFRLRYPGNDTFFLENRYPQSYPLTEESRSDWTKHDVTKFLLASGEDIHEVPASTQEGFLFSAGTTDRSSDFKPLLLTYSKGGSNGPLAFRARELGSGRSAELTKNKLFLPAINGKHHWIFSIENTYNWSFSNRNLEPAAWQMLLFGSLLFFFFMVMLSSWIGTAASKRWVWQLLSCLVLVMLTTRFFLYWRYKSFPPFDGMDLPSQQQLMSFSNFGVIILVTIVLAICFGFGVIRPAWLKTANYLRKISRQPTLASDSLAWKKRPAILSKISVLLDGKKGKAIFFLCWIGLLLLGAGIAAISDFDPGVCRRLAILFTLAWFLFLFNSYRFSPLVQPSEKAWWRIRSNRFSHLVISNPVKIFLSISLLAFFAFIDIGFAIVFLNFLFFNEAFLCINYGIAGLSTGSRKNAVYFGLLGFSYLLLFVFNLFFAPYVFRFLMNMSTPMYLAGYALFASAMAWLALRILPSFNTMRSIATGVMIAVVLFLTAWLFFPKDRILDKAAMTRYRIDVLTTPVEQAIMQAYADGKTHSPVIRAAQNQWFINTFIYERNNPFVQSSGFELLPHAPQNKGARYNAQATDLVASRFLVAEHGKWSVLLYALLLLLPGMMLASFYKLYPDFTNRTNQHYPSITIGFSILNYLLTTALLVILAATGRYIFFGQDLPFASILSKQSILFPGLLILGVMLLFRKVPAEQYANRKKNIPGIFVFVFLALLLFLFKPVFNKNREFNAGNLAAEMETYVQLRLQPVLDHIDTAAATRRLSMADKDRLFTDTLRYLIGKGVLDEDHRFFSAQVKTYARSGMAQHLDQRQLLYLDLYTGRPRLSVNDNFFRVEAPPHLQQLWSGHVFGDSTVYNISLWDPGEAKHWSGRIRLGSTEERIRINEQLVLSFANSGKVNSTALELINYGEQELSLLRDRKSVAFPKGSSYPMSNPGRIDIVDKAGKRQTLIVEPDAFMKNYYVNGSRYYHYPMKERFIWARNFAEAVAPAYSKTDELNKNAFLSLDFELTDSLTRMIEDMMTNDLSYHPGAEYGICIADGNGRILAMADHIKDFVRPDPNDKALFNRFLQGDNGIISQSVLRKQIGNINLLRMNPGPGSTFKPIVFSAIASQLAWSWDGFAAEGFNGKQQYFGGEKVPEYDFEKNNGRISNVKDYLKYSDNYYHANVLLLGSYRKQDPAAILSGHFMERNPGNGTHWPSFTYTGRQYWLDGFENWPGYEKGKANFGADSSFTAIGLLNNFDIYTKPLGTASTTIQLNDTAIFKNAWRRSGFILPEYSLFDQQGQHVDHRIPYDLFTFCFRGHVKGSSQVLVSPAGMVEAFGRLASQSRDYHLSFNPGAHAGDFHAFDVDAGIAYNEYLSIIREKVFAGMHEALFRGTAARLGAMLKDASPYYYYAKTGTTGDDELKTKSKLLALIISAEDMSSPDHRFRENKFVTVYFTSQNGPAKQNEEFQARVVKYLQETDVFRMYMRGE